tara:strand:+ start:106 stop:756 length:651 start_codon:yes stop_codon:yes gene_type:complete
MNYKKNIPNLPNIKDTLVPKDYDNLYMDISYDVQIRKSKNYGLTEQFAEQCIKQLKKRPYYLIQLAKIFEVKNIAEVGTAEGLQFFSFAKYAKEIGGHVWSCDIKDVRNKEYSIKYGENTTFCLGDSAILSEEIDKKIDMFYIDGAHDYGSVIKDIINLKKHQSENPIWIFDDYDERFGCYSDIKRICDAKKSFKYFVGNTASGYPNHQALIVGKL